MDNKIDTLRKFFTISVAAFEMQHTISTAFGFKGHKSNMHMLHLKAKKEIEKEQPNFNKIDALLEMMEDCADLNNMERSMPDKFIKGGI